MKRRFFFKDTCEPLIPSSLRMPDFYSLCRHIAAPNFHSSRAPHGRAREHLHTHSSATDHFLWFPCLYEVSGESSLNKIPRKRYLKQ